MKPYMVYVVTGADSGLGAAIYDTLTEISGPERCVIAVCGPGHKTELALDLTEDASIMETAAAIKLITDAQQDLINSAGLEDEYEIYPVLINCAGVNYIDWFEQADFRQFDRLMKINVSGPMRLIQELIGPKPPLNPDQKNWFRGNGTVLNIVSNASHMAMTNSAFYNASKGAFHIATLSLARELRKTHGICVFGISPNKLSGTQMSKYIEDRVPSLRGWTPEQAAAYQLGALPAGEETDPKELAEFICYLLATPQRHKYLTNTIIPYGA